MTKQKRILYAKELLEKNFLPHVSISPGCETPKVQYVYDLHINGTICNGLQLRPPVKCSALLNCIATTD